MRHAAEDGVFSSCARAIKITFLVEFPLRLSLSLCWRAVFLLRSLCSALLCSSLLCFLFSLHVFAALNHLYPCSRCLPSSRTSPRCCSASRSALPRPALDGV